MAGHASPRTTMSPPSRTASARTVAQPAAVPPVERPLPELVDQAQELAGQGRSDLAMALYRDWLASAQQPLRFIAWFNLGTLLGAAGEPLQAQQAYREALALKPDFHQARLNLGHQLEQDRRVDEAMAEWRRVLEAPDGAPPEPALRLHALNNLARALETARRYDEAEACMVQSLELDPDQPAVLQHYVHLRQKQCRWPAYQAVGAAGLNRQLLATSPLAMLAAHDDPALQLLAARNFVSTKVAPAVPRVPVAARAAGARIRIGYLSGDLCMHAVGLLIPELLELHDRARFEVLGFCWSRDDGSPLRQRLVAAFDRHHRIGALGDEEAARLIAAQQVDVLVDLQGLTSGARPDILSRRPARLQMAYLGFPGTCGLPAVDYVVADDYVVPQELEPFLTEKPLRLPQCFQVSDRRRTAAATPARSDCGLPEHGFVFCSFNNNYKFTPAMFGCWMRILAQVPDSVLWLLADNPWVQANLQQAARSQGVDPSRLVFAPRAQPADYLARLRLVDLFLDTFPYNAGTTANDVLFMGSPLLTLSGRSFVSRMAGSLLTAVGLPDLIAQDAAEYERKAVQIGRNPRRADSYRRYLDEHRAASALFDIPQWVRDFEDAVASALAAHDGGAR